MSELPGGVGVSYLTVYPGGGSPHVHLACSESYVVMSGSGQVETLTLKGFQVTPLKAGTVVWFPPGTIHRLVNIEDLKMVVLMQNSGLPEAGDAVMTFPADVLADPERYAAAAALPPGQADSCPLHDYLAPALKRRELAMQGFERLRESAMDGDLEPLREFHAAAVNLVASQIEVWRTRWQKGALHAALLTENHIDALQAGHAPHLSDADVFALLEPTQTKRRGMCGLLDTYLTDRFLSVSN